MIVQQSHYRVGTVTFILSKLLLIIGLSMTSGIVVALLHQEHEMAKSFIASSILTMSVAFLGLLLCRGYRKNSLIIRDGFLVVVVIWIVTSSFGALPYCLSQTIPRFTDAFFETMSGFTTTGASIIADINSMPKSIIFWRSLTQWLGGMGIVVLTVSILPRLGLSGLRTMPLDPMGPMADRIFPRISDTAQSLGLVYIILTVLEFGLLLMAGLGWSDALVHTLSTVSTGGFSTFKASIGNFNSLFVELIVIVFMLASAINFSFYLQLIKRKKSRLNINSEIIVFLIIFAVTTALVTFLLSNSVYRSLGESLRFSVFQIAAILTTTGFSTTDYSAWPLTVKIILVALMIIGGCAGSTAGGFKVIRLMTLYKQSLKEFNLLIFPRGVFSLNIGNRPLRKDNVYPITGFIFLNAILLLLTTIILSTAGHGFESAVTSSIAIIGNLGPGLGISGPSGNYSMYSDMVKWWLSFAMLTGRLEVYSVLVLLSPHFFRR